MIPDGGEGHDDRLAADDEVGVDSGAGAAHDGDEEGVRAEDGGHVHQQGEGERETVDGDPFPI